jgi:hypothetical protein
MLIQSLFFLLLTTQFCFAQWVQVGLNDESIKDITIKDATIFAITSDSGKVLRSIDNGINWTIIADSCGRDIEISQTGKVFMVIDNSPYWLNPNSLLSSTDDGVTWSQVNIVEQIQDSIIIYAAYGVYNRITISPTGSVLCNIRLILPHEGWYDWIARSDDDGITWSTPGMGVIGGRLFDFKGQSWITIGQTSVRYGGTNEHLNLSNDNGNTWNYLGWAAWPLLYMVDAKLLGLFSNDNIIIGGIGYDSLGFDFSGIILSTDMCSTWTQISSLNTRVGLSYSSGSEEGMLIGTEDLGVFLFSNEGDSLGLRNEGLTILNVQTLTLDNNGYVYVGTGNGVWRRPLSEIVTSVEEETNQPTDFILSQNYPNPFNPNTTFRYSIPQTSNVVIKVFDVLGNEIETLVNEEKPVGTYEITWNATNLSSGIYFYQLRAGSFVETKKMILMK